jgi:hypothetical protein
MMKWREKQRGIVVLLLWFAAVLAYADDDAIQKTTKKSGSHCGNLRCRAGFHHFASLFADGPRHGGTKRFFTRRRNIVVDSSGLRITGLWASEGTSTSDALQNVMLSGPISIGYCKETHYDSVVLEIRNVDGVLVYSDDVTGTAEETQQKAVWEMRWNRPPYAGDICNPAHNPYSIKLIGTTGDRQAESNEATVVKFLEFSCDLEDSPAEPGGYASGLYPPMLGIGGDGSERLRIGIVPESDDGTHAIWPGSDYLTEFSNLPKNVAHRTSATQNTEDQTIYKASVRQKMLGMASPIPDGAYHVIMKNNRDMAGNSANSSTNGINLKWTFRLH